MGVWSVKELDKDKTEQSIINESARLNMCRESLDKLKKEYDQKRAYFIQVILAEVEDRIIALESSIASGEKYLNECKEHLKDFK